jgi:hypothetical protein
MFIELLSEITGVNALVQHDYTVVAATPTSFPMRMHALSRSDVASQTAVCWPYVCDGSHPILGLIEEREQLSCLL